MYGPKTKSKPTSQHINRGKAKNRKRTKRPQINLQNMAAPLAAMD